MKKDCLKLSLRPYSGTLFVMRDRNVYAKKYRSLFGGESRIDEDVEGRCVCGTSKNGRWCCIVFAGTPWDMAHELAHAVNAIFERVGIQTKVENDEPFCYMLSQLMKDASPMYGKPVTRAKRK